MTKKQIVKAIGFLILLSTVLYIVNKIYSIPEEYAINKLRYQTMYTEEENTWDAILIGTSVVDRAWAAPLAYNQTGLTMYPLSSDSQPIALTTYIIEEAKKSQDIQLVVVDLHGIRSNSMNMKDSSLRRVVDTMKLSANKVDAIQYAFEYSKNLGGKEDKLRNKSIWDYYVPFFKYHERRDIQLSDILKEEDVMKGVNTRGAFKSKKQVKPILTTTSGVLSELQKEILTNIIDYCEENDIELLFMSVPSYLTIMEQYEINAAFDFVKEMGCDTLNMNTKEAYEELKINYNKDFYNDIHMNSKGARKVTKYLASYIDELYEYADHREDERYVDWEEAYKSYEVYYEEGWK
ncbi:hypothetical protein [Anaerosporobacter sp.]|uniref:hypothetical protein n=1 Tax=Anaerosporobacter sp. TaxID=1872529 RepID=UPI00286F846D|nr:hypothetical protein [Anaerosporobacter sp.]